MTDRKFYKSVFTLTVLSEEPLSGNEGMQTLTDFIFNGDGSGEIECKSITEVNGKDMAKLLRGQGSDPEFFMIDLNGDDIDF